MKKWQKISLALGALAFSFIAGGVIGSSLNESYYEKYVVPNLSAERYYVQGESMNPTFRDGQVVFAYRSNPSLATIRGNIVLFSHDNTTYIKRVIGAPGDQIELKEGYVYINGALTAENYVDKEGATFCRSGPDCHPITVPSDHVFVLGDNRQYSDDSRIFGAIPVNTIEAVIFK